MKFDSEELRTGLCSICDEHIGKGFDHTECTKIKKELYGASAENKNPLRKINKKRRERTAEYFNKRYR